MKAGARSLGRDVADRVRSTVTGGKRSSGSSDVWETATTEPPPDEAPECAWCPICRAARRYREGSAGQGVPGPGPGPGAGIGSQIAGVSDTLAGLAQDAFSIFEQALRGVQPRPPARPSSWPATSPATPGAPAASDAPGGGTPSSDTPGSAQGTDAQGTAATGTGWPDPPATAAAPADPVVPDAADSDDRPVVGSPVTGRAAVHPQDEHREPADEGGDRDEGGEAGDGPPARGGDDQVERPAE